MDVAVGLLASLLDSWPPLPLPPPPCKKGEMLGKTMCKVQENLALARCQHLRSGRHHLSFPALLWADQVAE